MRFYQLTSAGLQRHIRRFPIYCSLLDHLASLMQTLRTQIRPSDNIVNNNNNNNEKLAIDVSIYT